MFDWNAVGSCVRCGLLVENNTILFTLDDGTTTCETCLNLDDIVAIMKRKGYTLEFKKSKGIKVLSGPNVTQPTEFMKKIDARWFLKTEGKTWMARAGNGAAYNGFGKNWVYLHNVEIVRAGKPKPYEQDQGWGFRSSTHVALRAYLEIKTEAGEQMKGMIHVGKVFGADGTEIDVECKGLGLWQGDRIDIILKKPIEKPGQESWFHGDFEYVRVLDKNQAVRESWKAKKQAEEKAKAEADAKAREEAIKVAAEEKKKAEAEEEARHQQFVASLGEIGSLASQLKGLLTPGKLVDLLRWTYWFRTEEGYGGKMCPHQWTTNGQACGCGFPGSGMRAPSAPLHSIKDRAKLLRFLQESGLVVKIENRYIITSKGEAMLRARDGCPSCGGLPRAYIVDYVTTRTFPSGATYLWESRRYTYICDCERKEHAATGYSSRQSWEGGSETFEAIRKGYFADEQEEIKVASDPKKKPIVWPVVEITKDRATEIDAAAEAEETVTCPACQGVGTTENPAGPRVVCVRCKGQGMIPRKWCE